MFEIGIVLLWMLHSLLIYQDFYLQEKPIVAIMVASEVLSLLFLNGYQI